VFPTAWLRPCGFFAPLDKASSPLYYCIKPIIQFWQIPCPCGQSKTFFTKFYKDCKGPPRSLVIINRSGNPLTISQVRTNFTSVRGRFLSAFPLAFPLFPAYNGLSS